MMYLDAPPRLIGTDVFSAMPEAFRRKGVRTAWADVFAPNGELIARVKSCAGPSCTNVAIGGANRDRLYVTESMTGTVLVADIGELK